MGFVKKMFQGIDQGYLVKSYLVGIFMLFVVFQAGNHSTGLTIYYILAFLLFPFATVAYDDLVNFIFKGQIFAFPILVVLCYKLTKIIFLFIFSPVIAPIGLIYVYFANGYHKNKN